MATSEIWSRHFGSRPVVGLFDPHIERFFDDLAKDCMEETEAIVNSYQDPVEQQLCRFFKETDILFEAIHPRFPMFWEWLNVISLNPSFTQSFAEWMLCRNGGRSEARHRDLFTRMMWLDPKQNPLGIVVGLLWRVGEEIVKRRSRGISMSITSDEIGSIGDLQSTLLQIQQYLPNVQTQQTIMQKPSDLVQQSLTSAFGTYWQTGEYHSPLPEELQQWYANVLGAGHSIMCILPEHWNNTTWNETMTEKEIVDFLVPVPVKSVLRGYEVREGIIVPTSPLVEYDAHRGLIIPEEDTEY